MAWPPKETDKKPQPQPLPGSLTDEIDGLLTRYPNTAAALIPALHACRDHFGYVSDGAMLALADRLGLSPSHVADTLSFYTMLRTGPVGKYHVEICQTLSCALLGGDLLADYLTERLGIGFGEVTRDGKFSLGKVECVGACEQAPAMLVNDELHGNMSKKRIEEILANCR